MVEGQSAIPLTTTKPSRSEELLDPNEQIAIAEQVRAQFDSLAPKRPPKPTRSDPEADLDVNGSPSSTTTTVASIPELDKLESLKSQPVFPAGTGGVGTDEEFVETSYYDGLISIDKQHHTTGTGFIRLGEEEQQQEGANNGEDGGGSDYDLLANGGVEERKVVALELGMRGNPAMNDWIPIITSEGAVDQIGHFLSSKPIRSG